MKKRTELLKFRSKVYTRVKAILLNNELVEGLSLSDLTRLKSVFTYDYYDNIKRMTTEVALLNDNKALKKTKCLEYMKVLEIQLENIIFLSKKIVLMKNKDTREKTKQNNKYKDLIYGEFD